MLSGNGADAVILGARCLSRCALPGQGSTVLPPLPCTSSVFLTSGTGLDSCCVIRATDLASYPTLPAWYLMSDSIWLYCFHSLLPFFQFLLLSLHLFLHLLCNKKAKLSYFIPVHPSLPTLQHLLQYYNLAFLVLLPTQS